MPGRPRLYDSDAERQREYRARQQKRRERLESGNRADAALRVTADRLRQAVAAAAEGGDRLARQVQHGDAHRTLLNLVAHFEQIAANPPACHQRVPATGAQSAPKAFGARKEPEG